MTEQLMAGGPLVAGACVTAIITYVACLFLYNINISKSDETLVAGSLVIRKQRVEGGFPPRYMVFTLFVPGLGHLIAGDRTRGAFFLCFTIIFVGLGITVADPWGILMIGSQWINLFIAFVGALILKRQGASGSFEVYAVQNGPTRTV